MTSFHKFWHFVVIVNSKGWWCQCMDETCETIILPPISDLPHVINRQCYMAPNSPDFMRVSAAYLCVFPTCWSAAVCLCLLWLLCWELSLQQFRCLCCVMFMLLLQLSSSEVKPKPPPTIQSLLHSFGAFYADKYAQNWPLKSGWHGVDCR